MLNSESLLTHSIGDTLGGHLDDMEADWSKPIVSMSLGCKAIFLLGGKSKDDPPHAMYLRSGDVVLMAGEARECFHGNLLHFQLDGYSFEVSN
jgi:alkylated DNA repair protein alkB family protein 1